MRSTRTSAAWAGLALATSLIGMAISAQPQPADATLLEGRTVIEFHNAPEPLPGPHSPITGGVFDTAAAPDQARQKSLTREVSPEKSHS
jgi:hypothetical protein